MQKFWLFITTLVALLFLAGASWAGQVSISGTHSKDEIKATCASVGGLFSDGPQGSYSCVNTCAGDDTCDVSCNKDGKCIGDCPNCGRRAPPPVLGGTAPVERTLKNSVKRPSKRY
jgi:hypothetical protein